ncbi:glycosyltransferase family 2 protein [Flavobacterium sp. PLA-1-15]|uniref:glycosyltransferase family 2 protein n=1 Tax=Flavobacterium sp. PLA-1-15 TaxID=3380533 RepID=UPI003B765783
MNIAVVILNWNGVHLLEKFLPSVISYSPGATVYVADNASTDTSVEFVKANFPSVKIVINKENYGFAKGYNEALKHIDADVYALVNSDIEVTENWLLPIIEKFNNEPNTAVIQPKILDYKNKEYFEYAGAGGGFLDRFGFPFCRGRIFDTIEKDNGQYDDDTEIFWASGACFFIRKEVFWELNGFDDDFFAHQEEIDLCWRIFNAGHTIKYCHASKVYHVGGATLQEGSPMKTFLNFRNSLAMMVKNLPASSLFPILFLRLSQDGIAGIQFILQGKWMHCYMILKSHFYFYLHLFKNLKKRGNVQRKGYYKIESIVFTYYIRGGKVFERLF